MEKILQEILDISPGNKFTEYIVGRVAGKDYRGVHKSQHNRYDIDELVIILNAVYEVAGTDTFSVPPADLSAEYLQDASRKEHGMYAEIVSRINRRIGKVTLNSLKKNFFVDLSRMGFIEKYDSRGNMLNPFKRTRTETVKLSDSGLSLINADTMFERHKIFTDGVEHLLGDALVDLVSAIDLSEYRRDKFYFEEYTMIFSDEHLDGSEKIAILDEWRKLNRNEQDKVLSLIKKYCVPKRFDGNKNDKRDYHNWRNETQQLMCLFKTTIYFQVYDNKFSLNVGDDFGIFEMRRSENPKNEYFKSHNVAKQENYELHHIVPLSYAKNKHEYALIDDYKNLVYIHRDKHRKIKRNHIIFGEKNPKIYFINRFKNSDVITAKNGKDTLFESSLLSGMKKYNKQIVKSILKSGQ